MIIYSKHIFTDNREMEGYLEIENGKILSISPKRKEHFNNIVDYSDYKIIPGYMDIHIHGWATGGFWSERTSKSLYEMKKHLPKTGVTSFLGTTGTDSIEKIKECIYSANSVMQDQRMGAELLGVHLEGPFINKEFKGMQKEEFCIDPSINVMREFIDAQDHPGMIKFMTIAPELPNSEDVIAYCKSNGIQCSIGHSSATFDDVTRTKNYGIGGVIHMFSGMKGFHHRELGVAGSALYYDDLVCEFAKQTGNTVRHEAFDIVFRLKGSDGIYLTTDCVALAKMDRVFNHYIRGEVFTPLGNNKVEIEKKDGTKTIIDTLDYESVKDIELSYEKSVQNMAKHTNVTTFDIIKMTSLNPAKHIGLENRKGRLKEGYDADIVVVDNNYSVIETYCMGIASVDL